jgi:O-antigen/teichoic acid export membrane protein
MGIGMMLNYVLVLLAVQLDWSLKTIFVLALGCAFVPDLVCGLFAMRRLPGVRIDPRCFSRGMVRETMSFSLFAYISTVSYLVLARTDQLVISTTLSVTAVAIYQAGAKIAEMFSALGHQLPDTFSPAAAHFHAKGDQGCLQRLLTDGTRFTVMLATPVYLVAAFYMDGLLTLLTGEKPPNRETFWVAQALLLWGYTIVLTQGVSKRVFMMCGHERKLMWLGVGEAALNLVLSIGLVLYFKNVVCVALGSLVSSFVFGWFYLWPWAAREVNLSGWALARTVLLPSWLACSPLLGLVLLGHFLPHWDFPHGLLSLALQSTVALLIAAWGLWRVALTALERAKVSAVLSKIMERSKAA